MKVHKKVKINQIYYRKSFIDSNNLRKLQKYNFNSILIYEIYTDRKKEIVTKQLKHIKDNFDRNLIVREYMKVIMN